MSRWLLLVALGVGCDEATLSPEGPVSPGLEGVSDTGAHGGFEQASVAGPGVFGEGSSLNHTDVSYAPETKDVRRVLVVIADDFGVDSMGLYADTDGDGLPDDGRPYATTPTLDHICKTGVRFTSAWAYPTCSPTRASILTGRQPRRHGVGGPVFDGDAGLSFDEPTLPRWLATHPERDIATANIGKWHVGVDEQLGHTLAPNNMGWQHYAGLLSGAPPAYDEWMRTVDGVQEMEYGYSTSVMVDDAIRWLDKRGDDESWLLWLAFNAPHDPWHLPPDELHYQDQLTGDPADDETYLAPWFHAMVEAMDTELGRLLGAMRARGMDEVDIIFIGDNGTDGDVVVYPYRAGHAKGSMFNGGVHVPMCITGPSVAGQRVEDAPVGVVDIYSTVGEMFELQDENRIAGFAYDSISMLPMLQDPEAPPTRRYVTSEVFKSAAPDFRSMGARNERYELLRPATGGELFYDLEMDPIEAHDMMAGGGWTDEAEEAYDQLVRALDDYEAGK